MGHTSPTTLARREAQELRKRFPSILAKVPTSASSLARAMGIIVDAGSDLGEPGRIEQVGSGQCAFTIRVDARLPNSRKRVVVAHEIGHAVLASKYPDLVRSWDVLRREKFAHAFAREVLVPTGARPQLEEAFKKASDPMQVVRLSNRLGLSPAILFALADEYSWCNGCPRLWLRIGFKPNAATGRDPKLRVIAALLDRRIWYLPLNIGVERIGLSVQWLLSLGAGCPAPYSATILFWDRSEQRKPRFNRIAEAMSGSAVRLRSSHATEKSFIVMAEIDRDRDRIEKPEVNDGGD